MIQEVIIDDCSGRPQKYLKKAHPVPKRRKLIFHDQQQPQSATVVSEQVVKQQ